MYTIYEVKSGDTLASVANKLGITTEVLATLNGLNITDVLTPNTYIVVPAGITVGNSMFDIYTIKKGDTIYEVARKYNLNPAQLAKLNGLKEGEYIYPGDEIYVPKNNIGFYVTNDGDTLNYVTNALQISANSLANQNPTIYLLEDQLIVYKK